jgi:polyhydroxyalkanoate synthesis regulator phasin
MQAISVSHPLTTNKKIDQYLSENLPDMLDQHKIADRSDVVDIDKTFEDLEKRMDDLDSWKKEFTTKVDDGKRRIGRLKYKYGLE